MTIKVLSDPASVAKHAAFVLAEMARESVSAQGHFLLAVNAEHTPWLMLRALAEEENEPWPAVSIVQVDERVAPDGCPDRNLTHLRETLLDHASLPAEHIYAMSVESPDLQAAAESYARKLDEISGTPTVLDVVHLGLGPDGHTASLVPGDPALDVTDSDVAPTDIYQGRQRLTLTYPIVNRSRQILWVVTGKEKVQMLKRLRDGDQTILAGRIRRDGAFILADQSAASGVRLPDW